VCSIPVFLNRRAAARYRALASIIPGPRLIEKRIYRAAVSQRLRTTGLYSIQLSCSQPNLSMINNLIYRIRVILPHIFKRRGKCLCDKFVRIFLFFWFYADTLYIIIVIIMLKYLYYVTFQSVASSQNKKNRPYLFFTYHFQRTHTRMQPT
jgi:hypothetical protein